VHHLSTVDRVKGALEMLGWKGSKTNEIRDLLSNLKDKSVQLFDGPYRYIVETIQEIDAYKFSPHNIVFVDSREPEEIARFAKDLDAITILMCREPQGDLPSNHADNNVEQYDYDFIIDNTGTLEDLSILAHDFMKTLFKYREVEV